MRRVSRPPPKHPRKEELQGGGHIAFKNFTTINDITGRSRVRVIYP
jgi:hypothetical protein